MSMATVVVSTEARISNRDGVLVRFGSISRQQDEDEDVILEFRFNPDHAAVVVCLTKEDAAKLKGLL